MNVRCDFINVISMLVVGTANTDTCVLAEPVLLEMEDAAQVYQAETNKTGMFKLVFGFVVTFHTP